jgi:hypothetical protein
MGHREDSVKNLTKFIIINNVANNIAWGTVIKLTKNYFGYRPFNQHVNSYRNFPYIPIEDFPDFNPSKYHDIIVAAFTKEISGRKDLY